MKLFSLIFVVVIAFAGCGSSSRESLYAEGMKQMQASNPGAAVVYFKNALEKDGNFLEARFQLAKAYALLGKNEQAEKEFTKVLTQSPARDEVLLELSKVGNALGKGEEGLRFAQQYLTRHPEQCEGLEAAGLSCLALKKYDDARSYLTRALAADPGRSGVRLELASVAVATGDTEQGKTLLNEVVKSDPRNSKALFMLAALEKGTGNTDRAAEIYQKIIQADRSQTTARYKLGLILIEKGELEKAETAAESMVKEFPKKGDGFRLKGLVSFYRKDYGEAINSLQQSIKLSPTLEAYHFLGLSYYSKGELESALSQFRIILDRVPRARKARLMLAQTLLAQKRTDDGIAELKRILAEDDGDAVAHNVLGSAYMSQGLFDEGMRELNRATKLDPKMVNAHLKKGAFYFSRGRNAEGETELATAVQAAPDQRNTRLLLASYYQSRKQGAKALAVLQQGLTGAKSDAPLYNAIAALQLSSGDKTAGVQSLEKAKRIDPLFAASYQNLAGFYVSSGDYPRAIGEYGALLAKQPGNVRAMFGLAALSELSGRDSDALAYYRKAADTKTPDGYLALAGYYQKKGEAAKAIGVLDEAIKHDPRATVFPEAKGRILLGEKEYKKAVKAFDEVEALDEQAGVALKISAFVAMRDADKAMEQARRLMAKRPGAARGYLLLASVRQGLNDLPAAIAEAKRAVQADPNSIEARLALGNLHQAKREYDQAMECFRYALKLKADHVPSQFALAALYDVTGNKKEAAARYRAILDNHGPYAPALNNLAYLCADGYGRTEEALELAVAAFRLQPGNAGITDTVGYALLKNGKGNEAVRVLERAAMLLPEDPTVRYHLGLAYNLVGDRAKSQKALQKCLALGRCPETRAAQLLLAQLKK